MHIELANALKRSIERSLEEEVAIAFSGGLDSSLIAHVAKNYREPKLFSVGTEGCEDLEYSEKVAAALSLKVNKIILTESEVLGAYKKVSKMLKLDFLKTGILIPVYKVADAAKSAGCSAVLFGSGSEELFVGYDRYYTYHKEGKDLEKILKEEFETLKDREIAWIKKICYKFGVEARFPFYDRKIFELASLIPLAERMADKELKKGILREVGKFLGLPEIVLKRKKRAMQYGSGVQKILLKHRNEIG